MKTPLSLFARTLVLSFLCMCAVLAAGFFVLHAAIKARIKNGLKENLKSTQQTLSEREAEYSRRNSQLLASLSNNASLKAAVGLLREQFRAAAQPEVENTIEDELRAMSREIDCDLLMFMDTQGRVVASVGARVEGAQAFRALTARVGSPSLLRVGSVLYAVTTVPINLGAENLGSLGIGKRFDLRVPAGFAYGTLLDRGGVVASTIPRRLIASVVHQLSTLCGPQDDSCEIHLNNQTYLVLAIAHAGVGPDYRLLYLASLDAAMHEFSRGLTRAFVVASIVGILMAFLLAAFASHSIARPLSGLASQLEKSGETGTLWSELRVDSSTREVNVLAGALNRAAVARRQVEADLREAKDASEAANRAKSEFLANVSHELRTPMNGILGLTELTLDSELKPDQRECLEMVKTSADSLLTIINDILDFSKIEAGKFRLDLAEFSLRGSLAESLKQLEPRAREKGLQLSWEVHADTPETVVGDSSRLCQIVINLVGNAVKFTEQGKVTVRAEANRTVENDWLLHVTVEDTGIGIPRDKQKMIFEAFSQADGSSTRKYGGTGLGLTICSQLVELMQGQIWVESEVGRGSRFHFTARLGRAAQSASEESEHDAIGKGMEARERENVVL